TALNIFSTANLPTIVAKVRLSTTSANQAAYVGISDLATASTSYPNNGIFFTNCDGNTNGAGKCNATTTWIAVVKNGLTVSTSTCPTLPGAATGTAIQAGQYAYMRIEVR